MDSLWELGIGSNITKPELIAVILVRVIFIMSWGLVLGFMASIKISGITAVYAVLRRDVDGTDMTEVFLPEPDAEAVP